MAGGEGWVEDKHVHCPGVLQAFYIHQIVGRKMQAILKELIMDRVGERRWSRVSPGIGLAVYTRDYKVICKQKRIPLRFDGAWLFSIFR